ncbi:MAG: DUF2029 domain-containing protein [Actinobacteria bacterium]|nr:DUF2029 domain-containing protein [Actinomycetota bacterium]
MAEATLTTKSSDRRLAVALGTAALLVLVVAPFVFRPLGSEAATAPNFTSFWGGAAMANDFISFWTGASLLREGAGPALYDMDRQHDFQVKLREQRFTGQKLVDRLDPFHTPPPLALLMLPLTFLPLAWAYLVWTGASLAGLIAAVVLPLRGYRSAWTAAVLMLCTGGIVDTLIWGQVDALFVLAFSLALLSLSRGRPFLGGVLLGVLWLKPQYAIVFPLVFLTKRRWAELSGITMMGAVFAVFSVVVLGLDGTVHYLEVLRSIGAFYPPSDSFIFPEIMINWRAIIINLWPAVPEAAGSGLVLGLGAATVLGALLAWRGAWDPKSRRFALQMLLTATAVTLASPHSHLHGMALLLPPLALVLARGDAGRPLSMAWQAMLAAGFVLTWVGWLASDLRWLIGLYCLLAMVMLMPQTWPRDEKRIVA